MKKLVNLFVGSALCLLLATDLNGQNRWSWPDSLENMQVLPKDWTGQRLAPVMRGFSRSLGVRCSHCHVGEEGQSLSTFDFVSDDNPNKDRAREMLRLLGSVNDHLEKIEPSGDKAVNMWCHTCHRGRPRPMALEEELGEKYRADGVEAALISYDELKEKFYGKGAYNFGEDGLNALGYEVMGAGDIEGALLVFKANVNSFPESGNLWDSLGEAYMKLDQKEKAIESYEKSLELMPRNQNAKDMLDQLRSK